MRGNRSLYAVGLLFAGSAWGCDAPGHNLAGKAKFFNGATPGVVGTGANLSRATAAAAVPRNGQWLLSPDRVTLQLVQIALMSTDQSGGGTGAVDCTVSYDKANPGLTQIGDCAFSVPPGTYTQLSLQFNASYQLFINDDVNGFYTTASGIVTTPPAGGAQPLTLTKSDAQNGTFGPSIFNLPEPLVAADTASVTLNVVIQGLQFFKVIVTNGAVSIDGANPNVPGMIAAVGAPAKVEFYSRQEIGTANSYCAFQCGQTSPIGIIAATVYYANASTPSQSNLALDGNPPNCTFGSSSMDSPKGYIALDAAGNLGWAMPSDAGFTGYAAEIRMARVSTIGGTTTLYCKARTTDPAPPGGSYASGAPNIAVAANNQGTFVLVGK